jgi:UV DNA damage endonuclease
MPVNLGYCCINMTLKKEKNVTTNRGMTQKTFREKGLSYVSELVVKNVDDLIQILKWNANNNITNFRISSDILPWGTEYQIENLPDHNKILNKLREAGRIARDTGQRISMHPSHFVKLASLKETVVENSVKDLELHSKIFDYMDLPTSTQAPINIHVGMNYSKEVVDRWISSYNMLSKNCKSRLVIENDDKANAFSIKQLYEEIHLKTKTPITFDYFHHSFHTDALSEREAAHLSASTWPNGIKPLFHYSESKNKNENLAGNPRAHADYVYNIIDDFGLDIDVDLEAKAKERALIHYRGLL